MDWNRLKIFHAVAETGSFSGAADHLKMSQSAVSRSIRYLEDHFQTSLLYRHTRGVVLSEQGELLFKASQEILMQLIFTQALLADEKDSAQSVLRIHAPSGFGILGLSTCIVGFMEAYPELRVDISVDYNDKKKLDFKNIDVAIHTEPIFYADLISIPILKQPFRIYASRAYLKKYGVPFKPQHLDHHRLICFDAGPFSSFSHSEYLLDLGANTKNARRPFLSVNSILGVAQSVEEGLGIGLLNPYMVVHSKNIVQILPETLTIFVEFYLIYPEKLQKSPRIQALQKFIFAEIKALGGAV